MSFDTVDDVNTYLAGSPAAIECAETVLTSEENEVALEDLGTPTVQEWDEIDRDTTTIVFTGPDDAYSISLTRIDTIEFELSTDTSKTCIFNLDWS